jgi:hypothetical protein
MSRKIAALLIAAPLALGGCGMDSGPSHVDPNAFAWSGAVPAGQWVHLRNVTGRISVVASDSSEVEVHATKRWRGSDRSRIRFVKHDTDDGVIICTIYRETDDCTLGAYSAGGSNGGFKPLDFLRGGGSHASVDYIVRVPAGVKVDVGNISGPIGIADVTSAVKAETVNGKVQVATRYGPVTASSVNGSVTVAIDSLTNPGDIDISTVNGSVTAQLPSSLQAQLSMETVNGKVSSDYEVTGSNTSSQKEIRGMIGGGGRRVALETVNGSVRLRRGS